MMDPRPVQPLGRNNHNDLKRFWNESSRTGKAFYVGSIITILFIISYWTLRLLIGWYFLLVYYARAVSGTGLAALACHRVKQEESPFRKLSNQDWFQLQRCRGVDWGFDRHDELLPSPREVITYISLKTNLSPFLAILVSGFFAFWVVPLVGREGLAILRGLANVPRNAWAGFLFLIAVITFFPIYQYSPLLAFSMSFMAISIATLLLILNPRVAAPAEGAENPLVLVWGYIVSTYENLARELPPDNPRHWPIGLDGGPTCAHHPTACDCFGNVQELNRRMQYIQDDHDVIAKALVQRTLELEAANKVRYKLELQADICQQLHSGPDFQFVQQPQQDSLRGELEGQRRKVYNLELERDQLTRQVKEYRIAIDRLQAQVNWAQGAGEDKTQAQFLLDQEKAKNRELTKRVNDQGFKIMHLNQQLAHEKETRSEKCKDSSGCQRTIRDLQEKLQRVLDLHQEYEIWVRNAAVNFGMTPEQAQRLTLEQYIELLSQYVVQQHAKNTPGFDVKSLAHMFRGDTNAAEIAYRERLESEVKRLGGNIVSVRIGLDTSRPSTYRIKAQTYEENFQRVFQIYEAVAKKVLALTKAFTDNRVDLPVWIREKNLYFHEPWAYLGTPQNDRKSLVSRADYGKSPNSEYLEAVTERLVRAEIQRWYNRGLQLLTVAKESIPLKNLPPGPFMALEKIKKELDPLLSLCLRQVLDDIRPLSRSPNDSAPSPRMVKKFEIYKAMKAAVFGQTQ